MSDETMSTAAILWPLYRSGVKD